MLFREALAQRPVPHPFRSDLLNDLSKVLVVRFWHTGRPEDLEEAIAGYWEAYDLLRSGLEIDSQLGGGETHDKKNIQDQESSEIAALASSTLAQFHQSTQISSLDTAVSLHREALILRTKPHIERSQSLSSLAIALSLRFYQTSLLEDLDEAISLGHEALVLWPSESHTDRTRFLSSLSATLLIRFGSTAQLADMDDAVEMLVEALGLDTTRYNNGKQVLADSKESQSGRRADREEDVTITNQGPGELINFANNLLRDFELTGQLSNLETSISLYQEMLDFLPAQNFNRQTVLTNLGGALKMRFDQTGQTQNLDEAIVLLREVLLLRPAPHPTRSVPLNNLASVLNTRFCQTGAITDIDEAIVLNREALVLHPDHHPNRSASLNNLASALNARFSQTAMIQDVDEAIALLREAVVLRPVPHPDRSQSLNSLAAVLQYRFGQTGIIQDMDEGISLLREALALLPAPHPGRSMPLNNLAIFLLDRFDQTGMIKDLDEAISLHRESLVLLPAPHPNRSASLNNLASVLHQRSERTDAIQDMSEAIACHREALALRPAPHPDRSDSLHNLANSLGTRFHWTGMIRDLDEAIALHREALALVPTPHPRRSEKLTSLANALDTQFIQTHMIQDVDEAIALHREALLLQPASHPDRPALLNNLANVLETRFHQTGIVVQDIDEAIALHRDALLLRTAHHPGRSDSLHNLGIALRTRFAQLSQLPDLEESIIVFRESLHMLPQDHRKICQSSGNLACALMRMYFHNRQPGYFDDAIAAFRTAVTCESAPALTRLRTAKVWAHFADSRNHSSALEAYQHAISLLPRLAMLSMDIKLRRQVLAPETDGLARNAAAFAIHSGQFGQAVEFLEEGRNIFWSQALKLRTPFDQLLLVDPDLAQKLYDISRALEHGALRDVSENPLDSQRQLSLEQEAARYHQLDKVWLSIVEEVRKLEGFDSFLRPSPLAKLQKAAANGPIVILNSSEDECTALIMTSSDIKNVPLPQFTTEFAWSLVKLLQHTSSAENVTLKKTQFHWHSLMQQSQSLLQPLHRLREDRHAKPLASADATHDDILQTILAILWISVAEPVVRCLALTKSKFPPRLWWYPSGPFAFLPMHAAGIYNMGDGEMVSDYVVSSYTPTLNALLTPLPPHTSNFRMLAIIQPHTPGHQSLPSTYEELLRIQSHVPQECLVTLGVPDTLSSVENVLSHLSTVSIVHLACHGIQDSKNALESALILDGGQRLKISRIMEQAMPNASLAFLSACQTAMGDHDLPDEAIHLAASLLFAGFRGAVATMWSIFDEDGPTVADSFYRHLFQPSVPTTIDTPWPTPDTTQAARALHKAIAELRATGCSFKRWVPFVHFGL